MQFTAVVSRRLSSPQQSIPCPRPSTMVTVSSVAVRVTRHQEYPRRMPVQLWDLLWNTRNEKLPRPIKSNHSMIAANFFFLKIMTLLMDLFLWVSVKYWIYIKVNFLVSILCLKELLLSSKMLKKPLWQTLTRINFYYFKMFSNFYKEIKICYIYTSFSLLFIRCCNMEPQHTTFIIKYLRPKIL